VRASICIALACGVVLALVGRAGAQPQPAPGPTPPGRGDVITIRPGEKINQPVNPLGRGGQPGVLRPGQPGKAPAAAAGQGAEPPGEHGDVVVSHNKLSALFFWLFALIVVGGAAFVITRRNLISAVMGMVGAFFGIAACYMLLFASFLSVIQMLVYAGAIMVLFVFVIMILNKPEDEPFGGRAGLVGKGLAGLGLAYLGYRFVSVLWSVNPGVSPNAALAPPPVRAMVGKTAVAYDWGGVQALGDNLFTDYLFPFEAVSILLLVAVVGAIAVARPLAKDEGEAPPEVRS
jgi:NADH-quinone oxidoreductase subunit J